MKNVYKKYLYLVGIFAAILLSSHYTVLASTTDGTVDLINKWAWSENAGWIDFAATSSNVHITDTTLTGYAYAENIGWISFNCSNTNSCATNAYAVTNNGEGALSGYAWGENTGWVHFAPSSGGVTISSSGFFTGTAYSENIGWIVFNTDHPVTTDWRPSSSRAVTPPISLPVIYGGSYFITLPRETTTFPNGSVVYMQVSSSSASTSSSVVTSSTTISMIPVATPGMTTPSNAPPRTVPPDVSFKHNRQLYDRGEDIRDLQKFLNSNGFIVTQDSNGLPGGETSLFGKLTFSFLKKFQTSVGLPSTGYFGPLTRAFIQSTYKQQ
jgi:Putative peptidoglycan binding domain